MVVLADGGRLLAAAAWAGGVPLRLDGDSLVVLTDIWGEVRLPRSMVRGIVSPNEVIRAIASVWRAQSATRLRRRPKQREPMPCC